MLPPASENSAGSGVRPLDLRVGRVVLADRVFRKERLLEPAVDVGEESARGASSPPSRSRSRRRISGKRVIVACNVTPRDPLQGSPPRGRSSSPGFSEGLALATVGGDVLPGTVIAAEGSPRPDPRPAAHRRLHRSPIGLLAGFEAERALARDDHARDDVTYKWMARYGHGLLRLYGLEVTARGAYVEAEGGRYPARDAPAAGAFVMNHRSMLDIFVNLAFAEAKSMQPAYKAMGRMEVFSSQAARLRAGTLVGVPPASHRLVRADGNRTYGNDAGGGHADQNLRPNAHAGRRLGALLDP